MKQISKKTYNDYIITYICVCDDCTFKIPSDIRVTCERIFQAQKLTLERRFIPLYKYTSDIYNPDILIIIDIIYQIYVKSHKNSYYYIFADM